MDDELLEQVDERLTYGDSRSEFFREALKLKLSIDEELEELDRDMGEAERREFAIEAVRSAVKKE
jgi:metal-responsive CopG/Arc/MetJ family transcriptional regulator